jgi:YjjG family noncanonical pyrimidine nucleotidase
MPKPYTWLWFDADGTLFDFNRAEGLALQKSFELVSVPFKDDYLPTYQQINQQLWQALERHEISPADLRLRRFESLLETLQLTASPGHLSAVFVEQLGLCADLIEAAYEVLTVLQGRYHIAIPTNGLQAVQHSRLARSTIHGYIEQLIISEEVGAAKPKAAFFEAASARTGQPPKSEVLMIGDSLSSDIRGAADYGLDTCWFNPTGDPRPADLAITYEISHLRQLLHIIT